MKQQVISYLSTCKDTLFNSAKYLYENPEESYKEYNACNYLINILENHNFKVEKNFLNIDTAFKATFGNSFPKICYICEYDAIKNQGHITGHNLISEISLGAAIGLSKVIEKIGGTVIVLGCPGEYLGGAKITMCKQGVFEDIDAVLMAHPDVCTRESGTSTAILPLSIEFNSNSGLSYINKNTYNALDAMILTFNILNSINKGLPENTQVDSVLSEGGITPLLVPNKTEAKFYIRADNMQIANYIEKKIKVIAESVTSLMDISYSSSFYELPYENLITNSTLSRLFCHNLKESGIIEIGEPIKINAGISLGTVSHFVPSIHSHINIIESSNVKYGTKEFASATLSEFAQDAAIKAAHALAFTGIDIIEKEPLLTEIKKEFSKKK